MSFRVTPEFKAKLDRAAKESGRSLAQEIELRLERSLVEERHLTDGLELGFGRQVAGLMLAIGFAANHATPMPRPGQLGWLSDPEAFSVVAESIDLLLKTIAPDGDREAWARLRAALHSKNGVDAEGRDSTDGPVWAAVWAAEAVINNPEYGFDFDEVQPLSSTASKWLGEAVVTRMKDRLALSSSEEE